MSKGLHQAQPGRAEEIRLGLSTGASLREVARRPGRAASTICRKLERIDGRDGYRAAAAQRRACRCRPRRPRKLDANPAPRQTVHEGLKRRWSPQQISARLKLDHPDDAGLRVSHETIYTYLYVLPRGALRRELLGYLRQQRKRRRPRSRGQDRRGRIPNLISIEERPAEVAERTVSGHWEGDLILGWATGRPWGRW